jgi:tellurite resistance protein
MVRLPGPVLVEAIAIEYDDKTDCVILAEPIQGPQGNIDFVPKADCFEMNVDTLIAVNSLVSAASSKVRIAEKTLMVDLIPVEFELSDEEVDADVTRH